MGEPLRTLRLWACLRAETCLCLSSPQPPWTPGPSGLCIPRCSVLGFNGRWVRKKEVCAPLPSSLPLPQLQLFGFHLCGRGSGAVMWFSWSPGSLDLSLEKREEVLTAGGSLPFFLTPPPNQTGSAEACPHVSSPAIYVSHTEAEFLPQARFLQDRP